MTLIEVMVSISIVAVILAVLLPTISRVRSTARDAKSIANLRTHAQAVRLYAGDHNDFAPFIADPNATYSIIRGGGLVLEILFFDTSEAWIVALVDDYYQLGIAHDWGVFAYPGPEPGLYQYSPSFIASPRFWNIQTRGEGQLRPNRLASVVFPASKAIFVEHNPRLGLPVWESDGIADAAQWGMASVDGSVRRHASDRLRQPVREGEGSAPGARFGVGVAGMHTVDGVRGLDW